MTITHLGAKRLQGTKFDRVNDSLGSSADGTNNGITQTLGKLGGVNQGYAGGTHVGAGTYGAAGGGGAGAVGEPDTSSKSGNGGAGKANPITGSEVGELSSGVYYLAGGGGGGSHTGGTNSRGLGGLGGGGNGGDSSNSPENGTANTGGGAGGDTTGGSTNGMTGGTGVVIITYQTSEITSASGGTLESGSSIPSGYAVRKFTSSGTFQISAGSGNVQYVVVAGGGGSGSQVGGGGGAGGFLTGTKSMSSGSYTVTIGAGGTGANTGTSTRATNGANSVFDDVTTLGGGFGADNDITPYKNGNDGGSGGGGTYRSGAEAGGSGKQTGAYSFDGTDDYVVLTDVGTNGIDTTGDLSIVGWINLNATNANQAIISNDSNSSSAGINLYVHSSNQLRFGGGSAGTQVTGSTGKFTTGTWYHVAVVKSGTNCSLYVDGVQDGSTQTDWGTIDGQAQATIGAQYSGSAYGDDFNGKIDDLAIYKRALTTTEISDLVNAQNDSIGSDGNMNNFGGSITYGQTGIVGNAIKGNDGYARNEVGSPTNNFKYIHGVDETWSINFWCKKTTPNSATTESILGNRGGGSVVGFRVNFLNESGEGTRKVAFGLRSSNGVVFDNTFDNFFPNDSNFHMVTITGDNSLTGYCKIYLDNTLKQSVSRTNAGSDTSAQDSLNLFREADGSPYWNGTLDEISLWNRVLTSSERSALYNSGSGAVTTTAVTNHKGLKAYYDMNESSGTIENKVTYSATGALVSSLSDKSGLKAYYSMDSTSISLPTATLSENFSSDSAWTLHSSSSISGGSLTCTNSGESYRSTGVGKPTNLTWDFTWTRNSGDDADTSALLLSSQTSGYGDPSTGNTNVQFYMANGNVTTLSVRKNSSGTNVQTECHFGVGSSSVNIQPTGTTRYYRITKDGSVWTMKKFTSASDRTNDTNAEASTTATQSSTADSTWNSGSGNLTYLVVDGHGSQTKNYTIDDVVVYEGVTTGCKNDFSATSDLLAMTNLPVNTIFEQTDDTPSYWWKQSDNTWSLDGSVGTDISSGGWSTSGSQNAISEASGVITFNVPSSNTGDTLFIKSLPATAGSSWVVRYKLDITQSNYSGGGSANHIVGISDSFSRSGSGEDPPSSSKSMYLKNTYHSDKKFAQYWTNGSTSGNDWSNGVTLSGGAQTWYVTIANNGGSITTRYGANSDYTGGSITSAWTVDSTTQSASKTKIFISTYASSSMSGGAFIGTISDLTFYNNRSSVPS